MTTPIAGFRVELEIEREWKYIRHFRAFAQSFIAICTGSDELAQQVAMTTTELLENAVKFGTSRTLNLELRITRQLETYVRVTIENSTLPENVIELNAVLEQIRSIDSKEGYARSLEAAAARNDLHSKIGLARIIAEGKMDLWCEVVGDRVRLIAEHTTSQVG